MSDTEQKTPNKVASSGGAWSDQEKIAYLLVLCEHAADTDKFEGKTNTCHVPAGRTALSCRKLILRMKDRHKDDIEKIKDGQPVSTGDGEAPSTPVKAKTPNKRKTKAKGDGEAEGSPKKKATPRKKKEATEGEADDKTGSPKKKPTSRTNKTEVVKEEENVEEEAIV